MARYVLKRLLMMVVVVLGISFIVFVIMNLTPGNAAQMILGQSADRNRLLSWKLNWGWISRSLSAIFAISWMLCAAILVSPIRRVCPLSTRS